MSDARPLPRAAALLCVCGLAVEARIARRAGFSVVVGAGDRRRTTALVAAAMAGADCVVSFGIAGALAPELRPGDLILSAEIVSEHGRWQGEPAWRRRLAELARSIGAASVPVFGAGAILATRADKARLRSALGAPAVDLESDIVAGAAATAEIPFAVLRAIADPAERDIPPAALLPLAADGTPDLALVLASVLRRPRQTAALFRLAREVRRALRALERAAPSLVALVAVGARLDEQGGSPRPSSAICHN
jgi:adenosylhomocysteine nucleosidase